MKKTSQQTIKFYWQQLQNTRLLAIFNILAIIGGVAGGMAFPILSKLMVDIMTEATDMELAMKQLLIILLTILLVDLIESCLWRLAGYLACIIQPKVMANIMNTCFESLHKHSYKFFNNNFTGALVKKINRISRAFEGIADQITFDFTPLIIRVILSIIVLTYVNWGLGLILLCWTIFFLISNYIFSIYKLKHYDLPAVKADSAVTAQLADTITNHNNIKLFSNQKAESLKFKEVSKDWHKKTKASWFMGQHAEVIQGFSMVALGVGMVYLSILLWRDGHISIGDFTLIQFYLGQLFRQLWDFGRNIRRFYAHLADAEEMTEILNLPVEVEDAKNAKNLIVSRGKIEFKEVSFRYEGDENLMQDLSLKIKAGEKIALIGPSGGGKSTLTKLLLRLFDIKGGQIYIDETDISKVTQESLRKNIALVPQDPVLFHRTLIENIRYGNLEASDEAVYAVAKMAHCEEFIQKFPQGYETHVGERGVKLSGGERQRIAIARAMLSNARILILDEATSNLDSESEQLIQDALEKLTKNKTSLVIAHRLSTIVNMDRILVLKNGEIIEEGSHGALINQENSLYKQLWALQMEGYLG